MNVLHVDNVIGETCASYNEHVLAMVGSYSLAVCTYFPSPINVAEPIGFYEGKGTVGSFYRQFRKSLSENRFSIVHVHAPHVGALVALALLFLKPGLRRKSVYTVHSAYHHYSLLHRLLLVVVFLFYKRIVHCSNSSYNSFPWFYRLLAGRRRVAIPNGVDIKRIDKLVSRLGKETTDFSGKADGEFKILSIGRLIPIKNPLRQLEIISQLDMPQVVLYLIGEGALRTELEAEIERLNLSSRVVLTGLIPREQVYRELLDADLCISASSVEGLPIGLMEAMCCSCPVVISDIPSHRELAVDTSIVPLVDGDDVKTFASNIAEIVSLDDTERENLGAMCRQLIVTGFSLEQMHRGYYSIYHQLAPEIEQHQN